MDWLASQIIESLKENIRDSASIEDKRLNGRLGVSVEDLNAFYRVIKTM